MIVVTGAAGFIGSCLIGELNQKGLKEIIAVDEEERSDKKVNYSTKKWEVGLSIQNLLNTKWKETQFDTESQLQTETTPVSEIHFTPGTPFFARLNFTIFL